MTDSSSKKPDGPKRRANGTFEKGHSGNAKGRPEIDRRIPHPETIRDMQYDVAELEVPTKSGVINLLQANLLTLGKAGAEGNVRAARDFIAFIQRASEQELSEMARHTKRLDGKTPAFWDEKDPKRREALRKAWLRAVAEATGERQRTTPGISRKRDKKK